MTLTGNELKGASDTGMANELLTSAVMIRACRVGAGKGQRRVLGKRYWIPEPRSLRV